MNEQHVDLLISKLAGEEGGAEAWSQFTELATSRPELWHELAVAQRDQVALAQMVSHAGDIADAVEIVTPVRAERPVARGGGEHRSWFVALTGWSGWAVAAALAAAIVVFRPDDGRRPEPPVAQPVAAQPASADEAFQSYLRLGQAAGHVVGEMPTKVLLETRPAPQGEGYEVLYLRSVLERMTVPDLYRFEGQTEQGRPALVRWEQPPGEPM